MSAAQTSVKPQVGCYVFPHYHPNPYNDPNQEAIHVRCSNIR
jgi:uracil-DNA glycosylase